MQLPFAKPLYVMTKPVSSMCNLSCRYCYYLEKANLYRNEDKAGRFTMSEDLLERFIRDYIESQTMPQVLFSWHGGEALMRPLSFYKRVVELQKRYARGVQIDNSIQTNGTLLTDEWCEFFRENGWLVGVSIDGPQEFHDEYRRNKMGQPSFRKVMQGINLLNKHGVEWNALAVVNDFNADYPLDFYNFSKKSTAVISSSHRLWSDSILIKTGGISPRRWITEKCLLRIFQCLRSSGESFLSLFSMNGSRRTWENTLFSFLTPLLPTGWVNSRVCALWRVHADMPG